MFPNKHCPKCGIEHRRNRCPVYHAAYMRAWRKITKMTPEQMFKDRVRSYANVYKRRGKLIPQPCPCGSSNVEMHHPDYSRPLAVIWMCRPCHMAEHRTRSS